MNDILLKIMDFINNNTLLLIGICVFLILVLIGYLIDNSVKSKRIRNDIKNADQVPENIKNEIIKEAEEKEKNLAATEVQNTTEITNTVETPLVVNNENSSSVPEINIETTQQPVAQENIELNDRLDLDSTNIQNNNINNYVDPDFNIMNPINNEYSNDKRLSEILNNVNNIVINDSNNSIFSNNMSDIQINTNVDKNDVKIETDDTSDELDRIMQKLSNMNNINNEDEDSYTNIF